MSGDEIITIKISGKDREISTSYSLLQAEFSTLGDDAYHLESIRNLLNRYREPDKKCGCRACNPTAWWMVVCDSCGNKRCPHGTNHENACTNSNEPGQEGSVYK